MRRLLSTALILSLAACASTPAPTVQTAPPTVTTTEPPTTTSVEVSDAGAPTAATPEAADASVVGAATPVDTAAPATTATTTTTATTATTTAAATTTAPAGNPVAQGRAVYQRVCARCHEDDEDEGPTPNKRWAEARMRTLIRNGNRRMRAIPTTRLSDADLTLLVSYLRSTHAIQ
ncbi:MAG: cytochrome c [Deltaproteobacteria bacterium]|nr:cytochrome c [Deltaproteobacteria bacterium]